MPRTWGEPRASSRCAVTASSFPSTLATALRTLDYTVVRDALIAQLEAEGPGTLQLPTQPSQQVVCPRYRVNEEERFGGYCTIDMTFQEYGLDPAAGGAERCNRERGIGCQSGACADQVLRSLSPPSLATAINHETRSTPPKQLRLWIAC